MRKFLALVILAGLFTGAIYFLLPQKKEEEIVIISSPYEKVAFNDLKGWHQDAHEQAFEAFQISCKRITRYPDDRKFHEFGIAKDWKEVCNNSTELEDPDTQTAKEFFERNFDAVTFKEEEEGLFTGYYAPLYKGSRQKSDQFVAPLYAIPSDLQALNLGDFDGRLKGQTIIGEVKNGRFVPYKNRKEIDQGALENQGLELVWLEKPAESFFLQIQGSGFIELDDGKIMHLGYAQKNGRPYRAIGQYLIQSGDIAREDMSLQAIMDWMDNNPDESFELMWKNPSYVFFQERKSDKPIGSLGVGLTPGRSLAVDRSHIPLGVPLWLETYTETINDEIAIKNPNLKRLVISQDTGGAIKGKIRGDVYFGIGPDAELKAGPMKDKGKYYILVPKTVNLDNSVNLQSAD